MSLGYSDGGFLRGKVYRDILYFGPQHHYVKQSFGCIEEESDDFKRDPTIDGIWGVGKGYEKDILGESTYLDVNIAVLINISWICQDSLVHKKQSAYALQ